MTKCNEREVSVQILSEIVEDGGYNNIALRQSLNQQEGLTVFQKGFITEVVNGVLRNLLRIDYMINSVSSSKTKKMKPLIRNVLRAAVYELFFMNGTSKYAVCNEMVSIIKKRNMGALSGFVNGVLRNMIRKENFEYPDAAINPAQYLSVLYSCPIWMIERWISMYGFESTEEMCKTNVMPPNVSICVNTLLNTKEQLIQRLKDEGVSVSDGKLCDAALRISGVSNLARLPSFKEGCFHVMDESAMFAVMLLDPKPNECVLDICSAPGGKSFFAAYLMKNKGEIISNDIYDHKIKIIHEGAVRLHINIVKASLSNAVNENKNWLASFDKVLVDAPCTGFGVIRKKPDIKFAKSEESAKTLPNLQRNILHQAAKYVKPGGVLVYSTCTLSKDENEDNTAWFLQKHSFELIEEKTILPQQYDSDGFYISYMKNLT